MNWQRHLGSYKSQTIFLYIIWMIAMVFSMKFVISVAMIGLITIALFRWERVQTGFPVRFRNSLKVMLLRLWNNKAYLVITISFFLVLVTAIYSEDHSYTLERLRIKLPFLLLPFIFLSLPKLDKRSYFSLYYVFVILVSIACIAIGINYLVHQEEILDAIRRGQAMPTFGNHIRFSMMLALATLGAAYLWFQNFYWKYAAERWALLIMTIFLFGFIHVLSVRSGLVVLYLSIGFLALRYVWLSKRWIIGGAAILMLLILPWAAYQLVPSFKTKIDYSRYDLEMFMKGEGDKYSDSERLISLKVGWEIVQENLLLGVGAGDLRQKVHQRFKAEHPNIEAAKMPHNQFLSILAGTGIIGLCVFIFAFFFPLFYQKNYQSALFLVLHIILFFSFLVENTIENAVGVAFYLLFLLMGLNAIQNPDHRTSASKVSA